MTLRALSLAAVAALLLAWFSLLRPVGMGGPATYATVSGVSMEPRLHSGDLVIAHAQPSYGVGDVVVFRVPAGHPGQGSLVVHRIVGGDPATGFVVKGDNKPEPDPWRPTTSDVVGRSWLEVPSGGDALLVLRRPVVLAAVLGGLAAFWVATSGSGSGRRRAVVTDEARSS